MFWGYTFSQLQLLLSFKQLIGLPFGGIWAKLYSVRRVALLQTLNGNVGHFSLGLSRLGIFRGADTPTERTIFDSWHLIGAFDSQTSSETHQPSFPKLFTEEPSFNMGIVGKYKRVSAENYEEYLKALDVNYMQRNAVTVTTNVSHPVMEVVRVRRDHKPF